MAGIVYEWRAFIVIIVSNAQAAVTPCPRLPLFAITTGQLTGGKLDIYESYFAVIPLISI
jgi:hypothetical protein